MRKLALFPHTTQIEETTTSEHLTIAGCNLVDLADRYGTPLYLYDGATLDGTVVPPTAWACVNDVCALPEELSLNPLLSPSRDYA
jgi:hypothetical protein